MHADSRKLLWDALRAAERVRRFTQGKTFEHYQTDDLLSSAVERQLGIVGEALSQLRRIDPESANRIEGLSRAVGFRNVLVHGYQAVDNRLVWGVVDGSLGDLMTSLAALLKVPRGSGPHRQHESQGMSPRVISQMLGQCRAGRAGEPARAADDGTHQVEAAGNRALPPRVEAAPADEDLVRRARQGATAVAKHEVERRHSHFIP
ncbi:MAG: DUF86 domain-containing protein [Gammaproteobacteria bacterium]|nr:DUF86 domain-containing protein [Gammaproteobacteria bacterium]